MQSIIGYMKEIPKSVVARKLTELMQAYPDLGTQMKLAAKTGIGQTTIGRIRRGEVNATADNLKRIADAFGVPVGFLYDETDFSALTATEKEKWAGRIFTVHEATPEDGEVIRIPYYEIKAACGNGKIVFEGTPKGVLIKEASFFDKYGVPGHAIAAIYAEGNSMANFIVDGDIALFDTRQREPRSGKLFLINHPDGLRIKQLRRLVDGSWMLESLNPDKGQYPDETVHPSQAESLHIMGEFFYRQGG